MTDAVAYLTGAMEDGPLPVAIGQKFDAAGRALPCPGNTMLCHLDPASTAFAAFTAVQTKLKASDFAGAFTFLPPSSIHMTIFEGVISYARQPDRWPGHLPLDASVDDVTADLKERTANSGVPQQFTVKPTHLFGGLSLIHI